jgi:hypothetical protein
MHLVELNKYLYAASRVATKYNIGARRPSQGVGLQICLQHSSS